MIANRLVGQYVRDAEIIAHFSQNRLTTLRILEDVGLCCERACWLCLRFYVPDKKTHWNSIPRNITATIAEEYAVLDLYCFISEIIGKKWLDRRQSGREEVNNHLWVAGLSVPIHGDAASLIKASNHVDL